MATLFRPKSRTEISRCEIPREQAPAPRARGAKFPPSKLPHRDLAVRNSHRASSHTEISRCDIPTEQAPAPMLGGAKFSPGLGSAPMLGGAKFSPGLGSAPIEIPPPDFAPAPIARGAQSPTPQSALRSSATTPRFGSVPCTKSSTPRTPKHDVNSLWCKS